jgi:putative transposase
VKIKGETQHLWRAADHEGEVLEAYVTRTRDKASALKLLKKAMRRYGWPEEIVTDRLRSYRAAMREIGNEVRQVTVAGTRIIVLKTRIVHSDGGNGR